MRLLIGTPQGVTTQDVFEGLSKMCSIMLISLDPFLKVFGYIYSVYIHVY